MDNGMYNYGMPSPVMQGYNQYSYQNGAMQRVNNNLPHYEIIRVNGKPGVDAFQMGPNSSVILVDETAPIVWFVRTDGAGYKEAKPFDISLHTEKPPVDVNDLFDRITRLEGSVAGLMEANNNADKSYRGNDARRPGKQRSDSAVQSGS
jgi:hypothetical protein